MFFINKYLYDVINKIDEIVLYKSHNMPKMKYDNAICKRDIVLTRVGLSHLLKKMKDCSKISCLDDGFNNQDCKAVIDRLAIDNCLIDLNGPKCLRRIIRNIKFELIDQKETKKTLRHSIITIDLNTSKEKKACVYMNIYTVSKKDEEFAERMHSFLSELVEL